MRTRRSLVIAGVWAMFIVVAVHFLQFPGSVPDFTRASGGGVLLDAVPAFTPDGIYERIDGYGEAGRRNYSLRNVSIDVLLPLSVLPFLFLLTRRAATHFSFSPSVRRVLLVVPVLYVVFDLLENASVLALLAQYPQRVDLLAVTLPYTTVVKRVASLLALAIPLTLFAVQSVRGRQPRALRKS